MRTFRNMWLLLFSSVILGTVLLILVYALPVKVMKDNVSRTVSVLQQKGDYPSWSDGRGHSSILDYFTDAIMINTAIYDGDKKDTLVHDAMMNNHLRYDEARSRTEDLFRAVKADTNGSSKIVSYPRYWHGYLVYLKPFLMFTSVHRMKMINFVLQFLLLIAVMLKMYDKLGKAYVFAFALSILVINPITTAICLTYSDVYYIVLVMMIIMLDHNDILRIGGRYCIFFTVGGILTAYFDLLTYPFASLGIPTILYLLLNDRTKLAEKISSIIKMGMSWGFGYAGMWSGKWIMSSLLTGNNILQNALNAASFRINGTWKGVKITWYEKFRGVFSYLSTAQGLYFVVIPLIILIILTVIYVYLSIKKGKTTTAEIVPLLIVFLYPFIWYSVLQNHTIIHFPLFTHKLLSVSVFAASCIAINSSGYRHNKYTTHSEE